MTKNIFTINEMENAFEIGRCIQDMIDREVIEVEDSKEAFAFSINLAMEFENECPDTDDYYNDLDEFIVGKIMDEFGVEVQE